MIGDIGQLPKTQVISEENAFRKLLSSINHEITFCLYMWQFDSIGISLRFHKNGVYIDGYWRNAYLSSNKDVRPTEVYWDNGEPIEVTQQDIIPTEIAIEVASEFFKTQTESKLVDWRNWE